MSEPLSDEELAEIRRRARGRLGTWAFAARRLLATIDALQAERDEARARAIRDVVTAVRARWEQNACAEAADTMLALAHLPDFPTRARVRTLEERAEKAEAERDEAWESVLSGDTLYEAATDAARKQRERAEKAEAERDRLAAENAALAAHLADYAEHARDHGWSNLADEIERLGKSWEPRIRRMLAAQAVAEAVRGREDVTVPTAIARGPLREYERIRAEVEGE